MYKDSVIEWTLFFFIYCFIGWVWETCYVSLKKRKFTNRGFMNGPFLPIYGSGAITILLVTIPVKQSMPLTFLIGMLAATLLEYVTGEAMEAIFKVRYWDYSYQKFNLNGHICLTSSIAWGLGSILMVRVVHVPIARLVEQIPRIIQEAAVVFLCANVSIDMAISVRDALDIKEMLMNMRQNNEEIRKLQKRFEVFMAVLDDETRSIMSKLEQMVENRQDDESTYLSRTIESAKKRFDMAERIILQSEWKGKERLQSDAREELKELKEKLFVSIANMDIRKRKFYKRADKMLRRNPTAISHEYQAELDEIKKRK